MNPPDTLTQLDLLKRSIYKLVCLVADGTTTDHLALAATGGQFVKNLLRNIDELPDDFFNDMPSNTKKSIIALFSIGSINLIERVVQDSQNELN